MFLESLPINIFFQKYDDAFVEEVEDSGFKVQAESFQGTDRIAFYNLDTVTLLHGSMDLLDFFFFFSKSKVCILTICS